jgi:NADH:ubiquinone oxidoreductase subunit 3 (subunit A)
VSDYFPIYVYFAVVIVVTLITLAASALFPSRKNNAVKFMAYESGMQTHPNLLHERFQLRHYLVALMFLVFDVEVVFLYPWAVVAKEIGPFAFYEVVFFIAVLFIGFAYVWKKGGLQWE